MRARITTLIAAAISAVAPASLSAQIFVGQSFTVSTPSLVTSIGTTSGGLAGAGISADIFRLGAGGTVIDGSSLFHVFLGDVAQATGVISLTPNIVLDPAGIYFFAISGPGTVYIASVGESFPTGEAVRCINGSCSQTFGDARDVTGFSVSLQTVTPEPASLTLLATGLAGVFGAARRRKLGARSTD